MTRMSYGINLKLECKILSEKIRCRVTSDKSQMARTVVMRKGKGGGGDRAGSVKLTKCGNDWIWGMRQWKSIDDSEWEKN